MAFATSKPSRARGGGPRLHYVVDEVWDATAEKTKRDWIPAGAGDEGRELAREWAAAINRGKRAERAGFPEETGCLWTLEDAHQADMRDAKRRGLPWLERRESHWTALLAGFGKDLNLDDVTPALLEEYPDLRPKTPGRPAGNTPINRDFQVLRRALKICRKLNDRSHYEGNPFLDWEKLPETRRPPKIITKDLARKLVREGYALAEEAIPRCRVEWLQAALIVDLWMETRSRHHEVLWARKEWIQGGLLVFPPHKRGNPRPWPITGRVKKALAAAPTSEGPWLFPSLRQEGKPRESIRVFWKKLTERVGIPGLRPHDLRHSGSRHDFWDGATIEEVQRRLGHRTAQMAQATYTEVQKVPIRKVRRPRVDPARKGKGRKRAVNY